MPSELVVTPSNLNKWVALLSRSNSPLVFSQWKAMKFARILHCVASEPGVLDLSDDIDAFLTSIAMASNSALLSEQYFDDEMSIAAFVQDLCQIYEYTLLQRTPDNFGISGFWKSVCRNHPGDRTHQSSYSILSDALKAYAENADPWVREDADEAITELRKRLSG